MSNDGFHEDFGRREEVKRGSDRSFGITFAVVFTLIGTYHHFKGNEVAVWLFTLAVMFLLAALLQPAALAPFNRLWFKFGLLLHKVVNPVMMGLIFFLAVTPTALVMRLLGKNLLNKKFDRKARSYWIERSPPGPEPQTMRDQF